ncbi:DUF2399 domain-containing protein [Streptomyces sp. NPDC094048]|uniref:DUF2399 domain-containing protein n=1 Tax=Streptomyces sp. NPDC094048 TaxID=3155207 RepID=UPI00333311DA
MRRWPGDQFWPPHTACQTLHVTSQTWRNPAPGAQPESGGAPSAPDATGCRFAYHGDFNWPGIALANRIIRRYGARPWRMGAGDYEHLATRSQAEGIPRLPLVREPVSAVWDAGLAPAMAGLGIALHEEATLDLLVDDLSDAL